MAAQCTKCGFYNPPGIRYCGNCGTKLTTQDAPPANSSSPAMAGGNLAARFLAAGTEASGQRRPVTVLFVDLSGSTALSERMDPEELYYLMQDFLRTMAESVYKYDGFVDKFLGDGLMALFGAPIAQENNAELAIRAVLDMQASLEKINANLQAQHDTTLQLHAGLHSGTVIIGAVGSNMLMDYTAIGNTVNLASRLEQNAAAGTILVSERTYQQTKALFRFLKLPPIQVKGIATPITPYRLLGERAQPGLVRGLDGISNPMVGRQEEQRILLGHIQSLYEKRIGGMVIIRGHGGIGKSRLVRETSARIPAGKVRVLEGHSLTYRRNVAYWLFRDLLKDFINAPQNASDDWLRKTFRQAGKQVLGPRYAEQRAYLEYIIGLKPDNENDRQRLTQLDAEQLQQRIFIAMRDFLRFLAHQQALLLILEDLHWADEISLGLLSYLVGALREMPILIVGITRPADIPQLNNLLTYAPKMLGKSFTLLELHKLNEEQSETLLGSLVNLSELPASFRMQILQRAGGIPFYLEEIVRMLLDRGILERQGNVLIVAETPQGDLTQLGIPDSLQGLILTRFDQLPPRDREFLQVASAIGRQFNAYLVQDVLGSTEDPQESLANLIKREFIAPVEDIDGEYEFRHELVSDAIYGTILRRDRAKLHGKIGAAIERRYAGQLEKYIEVLARHYAWSDRPDRALHYLLLAGQRALDNYANEQAFDQFTQAVGLLEKVQATMRQYIQAHTGLGDVLLFTGQYETARRHYDAAIKYLTDKASTAHNLPKSILQRKIATTYEHQGAYEEALQTLQQAQHTLDTTRQLHPTERAQIIQDIGWIYLRRGNLAAAEEHLQRALNLVENTPALVVQSSILNRLGGVYYQQNDLEKASTYVKRSLQLRQKIGDLVALARTYNNLGLLHWKAGKWHEALDTFQKSLSLNKSLGDVEVMIELNNNLGLLYTDQGEAQLAFQHLNTALQIAKKIGHLYLEGQAHLHLSRYWLMQTQWEKAIQSSQTALDIFRQIGSQGSLAILHIIQGEAWLELQDVKKAEQALKTAFRYLQMDTTKSIIPSFEKGRALRLAAEIALQYGMFARAKTLGQESLVNLNEVGELLEYARTLTTLTKIYKHAGETEAAIETASQAAQIFQQLGAKADFQRLAQTRVLDLPHH